MPAVASGRAAQQEGRVAAAIWLRQNVRQRRRVAAAWPSAAAS